MHYESGRKFLEALNSGALDEPLAVTGLVKKSEDHSAVLFAPSGNCTDWISVPADMIEKATVTGKVRCHDHSHPIVELTFKSPDPNDAQATFFATLLRRLFDTNANSTSTRRYMGDAECIYMALNLQTLGRLADDASINHSPKAADLEKEYEKAMVVYTTNCVRGRR